MDFEDDNSTYISSSRDSADISNDKGLCAKDRDGDGEHGVYAEDS